MLLTSTKKRRHEDEFEGDAMPKHLSDMPLGNSARRTRQAQQRLSPWSKSKRVSTTRGSVLHKL